MRGGEASGSDGEDDVRERRGGQGGAGPDFPGVVPGANVEGRGDGLPRGAGVEVHEFEGDVTDGGGPFGDAQLARAGGDVTTILAAHVRDTGADLRLARYFRTPPCHCCPCHGPSSPSSVVDSRVGLSGERGERKLRVHREIFLSARTDKKMR